MKICAVCCREFEGGPRAVYCSSACRQAAYRVRRDLGDNPPGVNWADADCLEPGEVRVMSYRGQILRQRRCAHCGVLFDSVYESARYCSGRCRVAAHRKRRYEEQHADIEVTEYGNYIYRL